MRQAETLGSVPVSRARTSPRSLIVVLLGVLTAGLVIFRSFVFGDRVLLYKDIGSDSINDSYPYFVHLSDYVHAYGLPSWSFCVGLGQSLFYRVGDLIWQPVIWLPRAWITSALVFQYLLKLLLSAALFFRFLLMRGVNFLGAYLGVLLLVFSSYSLAGCCWYTNADEVVCFSFALFAAETAISRGRWIWLSLAVALSGLITVFHLYLCAVLLGIYVPLRLIELHGWNVRLSARAMKLAAAAVLGVGLSAVVTFGSTYCLLQSARGSGAVPKSGWSAPTAMFESDPTYYLTVLLRPFSNDLLGTGDQYRGWQNYFEAPTSYCGLFALLMLPQVFVRTSHRQRVVGALLLSLTILPVIVPSIRSAFWLFQGGYFRAFSLFSTIATVTLVATATSRYIERATFSLPIALATLFILLVILYFPIRSLQESVDVHLRSIVTFFLILEAALVVIGYCAKRTSSAALIILAVAAAELLLLNGKAVAGRPTLTKEELRQPSGYNDETREAIEELKRRDDSFYRVTKTWSSGPSIYPSLNDAMVFNYYGSSSYGSFNSRNYIHFLQAVDEAANVDIGHFAIWSTGLLGQPLLSTFTCEKYVLTENPAPFQTAAQYQFIKTYRGTSYLFRNKMFLPLGLTFEHCIAESIFRELPIWARKEALLHVAVLPLNEKAPAELTLLTLDQLKQQLRENSLEDVVEQRRTGAMAINAFRPTHIIGTVQVQRAAVAVFQMPFDEGWSAQIDGQRVARFMADDGLLALFVSAGLHIVDLNYRPPFLISGSIVTILALLVIVLSIRLCPNGTVDAKRTSMAAGLDHPSA